MTLLSIAGLEVSFGGRNDPVRVLHGVNLTLARGEVLGLVGESGSGKSVLAKAIMGLLPGGGRVTRGRIDFDGDDIVTASSARLRQLRGSRIAMIFQDPMATLNPVLRIDAQMLEAIAVHRRLSGTAARAHCIEVLRRVGIPAPENRFLAYPHELSGGMRQRIAIATALLNDPDLILADEATTALDVTVQSQILHELRGMCEAMGTALIWVSHDLAVVSGIADRIAIMYAGRIIECGPAEQVIARPAHPYTEGLIGSVPDGVALGEALRQIPGLMPAPHALPAGCAFHPRCTRTEPLCKKQLPDWRDARDHGAACHFARLPEAIG